MLAHQKAALQFDYEYLGRSIPELARVYQVDEAQIEGEVLMAKWDRKIAPTVLPQTEDLVEFAEKLEATTRAKLGIIGVFRQIDNQPAIAQLEKDLLAKAALIVENINPEGALAATQLNNVIKAVSALQERNPIDLAAGLKETLSNGGVVVQIMNNVG